MLMYWLRVRSEAGSLSCRDGAERDRGPSRARAYQPVFTKQKSLDGNFKNGPFVGYRRGAQRCCITNAFKVNIWGDRNKINSLSEAAGLPPEFCSARIDYGRYHF